MLDRIGETLKNASFAHVPEDPEKNLFHLGLDSLMLALWIIELEKEFKVKIPVIPLDKERFQTLNSVQQLLIELGAK